MSGFQVEVEAADAMADLHDSAAEQITDLAPSQPESIDGGVGGPHLLQILAAIGVDAGKVAQIDTSVAERVRTAVDAVSGYDAAAAGAFRTLGEGMP